MATKTGLSAESKSRMQRLLPGFSDAALSYVAALGRGLPRNIIPPAPGGVLAKEDRFVHRLFFTSSGTPQSFTFFNANPSRGVSNIRLDSGIQNNTCAFLKSLHFRVKSGVTAAGVNEAAGAQIGTSTSSAPTLLAESIRKLGENGEVTLKVGDVNVVDRVWGLDNFPAGAGMFMNAALSTAVSAEENAAFILNTGAPGDQGIYRLNYFCTPTMPIEASVTYQATPDWLIASTTYCLECVIRAHVVRMATRY